MEEMLKKIRKGSMKPSKIVVSAWDCEGKPYEIGVAFERMPVTKEEGDRYMSLPIPTRFDIIRAHRIECSITYEVF